MTRVAPQGHRASPPSSGDDESHLLDIVTRVGQAFAGELDLKKVVQAVTDATTELTGAQFGAFFYNVINRQGESYTLYTLSGVPIEAFSRFPMPRNTEVFAPTFRGEGVVRSDDIRQDPRFGKNDPYHGMPSGHLPVVSYLAVPVVSSSGEVLGGLFFGHDQAGVFQERHERIVVGIAAQAAVAIDNARLNRDLSERLSELETLLDVLPIGIGIAMDPECRQIRVNQLLASMLGLQTKDNASKTAPDDDRPKNFRCLYPEGAEIPDAELPMQVSARQGRAVNDLEMIIERDDGRTLRLLEYASPLFNEHGKPRGAVGAFVDITERNREVRRHRFLVTLDDAVRPLTDANQITATSARLLGEYLHVDRCAYAEVEDDEDTFNLTGDYCRGVPSIVGRYTFSAFGAEALADMRAARPYVVNDIDLHQPAIHDATVYRQTNIRAVICVPLHKSGNFVAAMAVHQTTPRDWTDDEVQLVALVANRCWESIERARVSRELQESEGRFRQLANTIPQLAWMARPDGHIFWYNDRWYDFTGSTFAEMQGWGWETVHDPRELPRVKETWLHALNTGTPWEHTFPIRRRDGEFRWHLSRARPFHHADGTIMLWFGTNTDVTEQRRFVEQREMLLEGERAARAEAERAGRMKDEFLATLSHELRTPLNSILGYATLLRAAPLDAAERDDAVATIERNARLQAQLIDDLLDMNRIISGKVRLDLQRVDLASVIDAAIDTVRPAAEAKELRLQKFVDPLAGPVRADPARIQQVIWNLLSNAVKFTPRAGRIQISLERVNSHVEITVADTGAGIAPDFLPHVFDRFRQADASTTRRYGGLGLGLSIVKHLVELHGGTARAKSPGANQGATFVVALPVIVLHGADDDEESREHPSTPQPSMVEDRPDLQGVRILVVDDDADSARLVQRVLQDCRATVTTAGSADQGFEILQLAPFDVLISDIGMPGQDGYEFIRRIRGSNLRNSAIPAIALTAFARSEDRRQSAMAGFQNHIAKPVETGELLAIVASLARRGR